MAILANLPPYRIYWHAPAPLFAARVNAPGMTVYPVQDITYDNVTTGTYTELAADMFFTLGSAAGLDDYGRGRLRAAPTSTVLKVNRSSQGYEDGELSIVDNAFITVYADYRVHSKIPAIINYVEYKDTDIPVGDLTQEPPPVANMGPDRARRIDASTSLARFFFDGATSYAVANGATITGYAWDIDDGTFVLGTGATDSEIYADFPAGARYVALTVTDSNGKTHTGFRLVLADDPDDSLCVSGMQVQSFNWTAEGMVVRLRVLQDLPRADYPDGAKVIVWQDRDPAIFGTPDPTDWSDVLFTGWHNIDEASSAAQETHLRRETQLTCVDVAGRLDSLPGFNQRVEIPDDDGVWTWGEMSAPNMDKFLHYLIHWHSTAASVADFFTSGTWTDYPFVLFDAVGDTLFNQLSRQAKRLVPDHEFTCNRYGQMRVVVNPNLQDPADRTATVQNSVTEQGWSAIEFGYQRPPRVHTLRGSAIIAATAYNAEGELDTAFCIAPGTAPGQGGRESTLGERLAQSQDDLNSVIGHHYARLNARYGNITVTLNSNADPWDFDPAAMTWVTLHTTDATAPQRGLDFDTLRTLCKEVSIDYTYGEEATTYRARVVLEPETVGLPALTEEQEPALPVGEQPSPFVPPLPGDDTVYYGDIQAYVMWDGAHVYRTWDLQAGSPTWEFIDTGITGSVQDGQYVQLDASTVGMWLMTTDAIWWCADIMATTPSWSAVLPIAVVQAADAVPATGAVEFKTMFHYWSQPGHLCVATGPNTTSSGNSNYQHAYFWSTADNGQTWTQVDMNYHLRTISTFTHGYFHAALHGMNIHRSEPIIWCIRGTPNIGFNVVNKVFYSEDLGLTWLEGPELAGGSNETSNTQSLLNPFPDTTDPSYAVSGIITATLGFALQVSTDGWQTKSNVTTPGSDPAGYEGLAHLWRVNKRTFDNTHVIAWFRHDVDAEIHLLQSEDSGATWSLLWDSGLDTGLIPNIPGGSTAAPVYNIPNGWPPDIDQWVLVRANVTGGSTTAVVMLTLDNFATAPVDKSGNINTLLGGNNWTNGPCDGYALPRVGVNA